MPVIKNLVKVDKVHGNLLDELLLILVLILLHLDGAYTMLVLMDEAVMLCFFIIYQLEYYPADLAAEAICVITCVLL